MALNFNVSPYFDDFDPTKNFHRILFKPGYAVQARELTQSQTILQNQISNFASNIFTQNTPVSGGKVTTNLNCFYIRLNYTYAGATISAGNFLNKTIQDATGTILAKVIATSEGVIGGDSPTLIVTYISGPQFFDGSIITPIDGSNFIASVVTSTTGNPSTGLSSTASISSGVFYVVNGYSQSSTQNADGTYTNYSIGNFVQVNPQTIILNKYNNSPSYRVGLQITETIYDYINDSSLLDPAIGASNYQAPGADRYVVTLTLTTLPLTLGNDSKFIELLRIDGGQIVKQVDGTVYSTIDDYFAKRDYETNGDYIVNDFKLTPSSSASGNSYYNLSISKGIAYVHGYRIDNQSQVTLTSNRAQSVNTINNNAVYMDYGNYFTISNMNNVFDTGIMPSVDLHCVFANQITSSNTVTYNSTKVGTAFIRNLSYVTGTGSNTKSYIYNAYVSDVSLNTLSGNVASGTASTITINDPTDQFSTVANAYYGISITAITNGVVDARTIVSYSGSTKVITVNQPFTITPTTSTAFTLTFNPTNVNSIVQVNGSYALTANADINVAQGKTNGIVTGGTIFYNTGSPELIFPVGYPYVAQIANSSYFSTRVYRAKTFSGAGTLTLSATSGNSSNPLRFEGTGLLSASAALQNFIIINTTTGNILDFSSAGNTITISSDHTTATIQASAYSGQTVDVIATVQVSNADGANFVLKSKNLISGNNSFVSSSLSSVGSTGTSIDLTKGQTLIPNTSVVSGSLIPLYVTDIKQLVGIYDSGSPSTTPTGALSNYTNVTNYYTLDNGQRDSHYDFGNISLIPGAPLPKGNLLVVYNYYSHTQASSGDGYFSIQSYQSSGSTYGGVSTSPEAYAQIPTYKATDGTIYKLSDCIDFRPSRANGQTAYIWEYSQTWSSTGDTGILIPQNLSNYTSNYYYYLGRQDLLVLTKDKSFQIIQGTASVAPSLPAQPSGSLLLANLILDPYTAYVPGENPPGTTPNLSINKVLHKRWAKSDISDLETRVNNLEYYTSLSILESTAAAKQITDNNGVTRPNYGILVDDFSSFATADTGNADYAANINIRNNYMTALQVVNNFQLQNPIVLNSLGTITGGSATNTYAINSIQGTITNIFTLPYTTANVIVQPLASSTVSVNPFSVSIQQGVALLNPPMDNWVDNTQAPPILITDPTMQVYQASGGVNLTNSGDFQTIPGTTSTISSSVSVIGHGINPSPFGYVGYTQTSTSTYTNQLQNVTSSAYNPVSSTFNVNNGYLTNVSILPYIRPQQIIVSASGLLVNTPITAAFDGTIVNQYITSPNTIELTSVTGTFNAGDIVGFYISNNFYPIARVIQVYNYPNGTQSRLYVGDIVNAPNSVGSTTLQNGKFDSNGNYIANSSTAIGTVPAGSIVNISMSGEISGVGGSYTTTASTTPANIYLTPTTQGYCTFLNQYGIWGDPNNSTSYSASFPVTLVSGATYTIMVSSSGTATVQQNGTTIASSSSSSSVSTTTFVAAGSSVTISWSASSSGTTESAFAMTIQDSSGNIVFSSLTPPGIIYSNAGTQTIMYGGGAYFTGATQVYLGPNASSTTNYYQGSQITITSQYVYGVSVAATYVPPPPAPSGGGGGGGGGGCCVVATVMANSGDMSESHYKRLNSWAVKVLDKNFLGERLHRGYHIIAPKVAIPLLKTKAKGYVNWSFKNATNMLMGKQFNLLSIPNSLFWITLMGVTGMFVTKEQSEKSWNNLYK